MPTLTGGNSTGSLIAETGSLTAGDTIIIREGSGTYTSGLDFSAVELGDVLVLPSFTGTIGAAGTSWELDLSASAQSPGLLEWNSPGVAGYIEAATEIQTMRVYQTGSSGVYLTGGTFTLLEVAGGTVRANDSSDVVALTQAGGQVTLSTHASQAVDTLNQFGGSCTCARDIGTANVSGTLSVIDSSVTPTTVVVRKGGVFRHQGGNIGTLTAEPGSTVDFSALSADITITTGNRYNDVAYIPPPQGITVTVSTANEFLGGGTFAT